MPVATPDQFGLERFEEAFDGGIVVAVAFPAHRRFEAVLAQLLLVTVGTVLRSSIRVMNTAWWRVSDGDGHVQRPPSQILLHAVADRPAKDTARKQINDYSQIDPALPRPDIGDVVGPLLVLPARCEILLQEIRRDVEGVIAVGRALEHSASDDLDAVLAHQTTHSALADTDAQLVQLLGHPLSSVAAQAQPALIADMGEEHNVTPLAMRRGPVLPSMEPAL